jgi:hypothetical protein
MAWNDHTPGDRPVILVGAGFPLAMTGSESPSTNTILEKTASNYSRIFPAISALIEGPLSGTGDVHPNRGLNFVWSHLQDFALSLLREYDSIRWRYGCAEVGDKFQNLVRYLLDEQSPWSFLNIVLGVELKRAVALHYGSASIHVAPSIRRFLRRMTRRQVTWISLNYDLVLEAVLNEIGIKWIYCFTDWLLSSPSRRKASHVLVKPHGSVNVIFETHWKEQRLHTLFFKDPGNRMQTCDHKEIGCDQYRRSEPKRERRPWLVGYLPDALKDELNSPVWSADAAHDLCKANVAYASLRLLHATSLYVLGYSLPLEDQWIWARLRALENKDLPIYVATANDTKAVIQRFGAFGFKKCRKLTSNGKL